MIRRFGLIVSLLVMLCCSTTLAQEANRPLSDKLIELEGSHGRILVFPNFIPGPKGPIVKFVMFGIYELPEVLVRTVDETITAEVTTVRFSRGERFSGWFHIPDKEIVSIWIDGWFISWEDARSQ